LNFITTIGTEEHNRRSKGLLIEIKFLQNTMWPIVSAVVQNKNIMPILNFEFKARTNRLNELEKNLLSLNPKFIGEDHQTDTYFNVNKGRLKLREGNIENSLIYYERPDTAGAKQSNVLLYQHKPDPALKEILTKTLSVKVVVEKIRKIYFIDNVKFHFDTVEDLGNFIEVEAIDETGAIGLEELQRQCRHYADYLKIQLEDFVSQSYSDLILEMQSEQTPESVKKPNISRA
jgi:adenylate cyclase, class 2